MVPASSILTGIRPLLSAHVLIVSMVLRLTPVHVLSDSVILALTPQLKELPTINCLGGLFSWTRMARSQVKVLVPGPLRTTHITTIRSVRLMKLTMAVFSATIQYKFEELLSTEQHPLGSSVAWALK